MLEQITSKSKEEVKCKECGIVFIAWRCTERKFCSVTCKERGWTKLKLHNKRTSETFEKIKDTLFGRSRPEISGEKSHWWKGGVSRAYKNGYYSHEYVKWRREVFKRDNYTCQNCKIKKEYVTAHHIKSFAKYPELRFELSNGLTLCEPCHALTDNYKGRTKK